MNGEPPEAENDLDQLKALLSGSTRKSLMAAADELEERLRTLDFPELVRVTDIGGTGAARLTVAEFYRQWLRIHSGQSPYSHAAWYNCGVELAAGGDIANAKSAYKNALAFKPDLHESSVNLGLAQEALGDTDAALDTWSQALQPDSARILIFNHRGRLRERLGQLEEAERDLRSSLLINPDQPDVIQHWAHLRQKMCLWPTLAPELVPGLTEEKLTVQSGPLTALALFDDVPLQTRIGADWLERKIPLAAARLSPPEGYAHDRIRVGYMSSDFRMHAMTFLVAELFERHDRTRFEIYGYCASQDDGSEICQRVLSAFDHYTPITGLDDQQAAEAIRRDEIDILIDLNGFTSGARLGVLRWKPAPIQMTYLGYIGPLPLPELDYIIADHYVIPEEVAPHYRPPPLFLSGLYQANDTRRSEIPPLSRAEESLPEQAFVYCNFANHYKITEQMFAAWAEILQRTENSVLWLAQDNEWSRQNMIARAARFGLSEERLIFARRVMPPHYMARLRLADLYLDSFPYNAGTVASDALRMELPLLTLAGQSFVSRMAGSLLSAIGLEELITGTLGEYVERAISLRTDAAALASVRARFADNAWGRTIGNAALFTQQMEDALSAVTIRRVE